MYEEDYNPALSNYHCSPEWHLARLRGPFAGLLYAFAHRISKNSGKFHGSLVGLAEYFGVNRSKVQRAVKALVDAGFLEVLSQERFNPTTYHVISHKEWKDSHPGCCAVKAETVWSAERGDPLGVLLWNISGGKVKTQPHRLAALRKTGLTDDQLAQQFERFTGAENERRAANRWHGRWKYVSYRFLQWLKGEVPAKELSRLGLEPCAFEKISA